MRKSTVHSPQYRVFWSKKQYSKGEKAKHNPIVYILPIFRYNPPMAHERPIFHSVFTMERNTHVVPLGKWQQLKRQQIGHQSHGDDAHGHTPAHHEEPAHHAVVGVHPQHTPEHAAPVVVHPQTQEHHVTIPATPHNVPEHPIITTTHTPPHVEQHHTTPRIEALTMADIPAFRTFMIEGLQQVPYLTEPIKQHQIALRTPAFYQEAIRNPNKTFLITKDSQGRILGGMETEIKGIEDPVVAGRMYTVGHVNWIITAPEHRRQGVGRSLYQDYERRLRQRGNIDKMMAHVHDANERSLGLHRRMGITGVLGVNEAGTGKFYFKDLRTQPRTIAA